MPEGGATPESGVPRGNPSPAEKRNTTGQSGVRFSLPPYLGGPPGCWGAPIFPCNPFEEGISSPTVQRNSGRSKKMKSLASALSVSHPMAGREHPCALVPFASLVSHLEP